MRPLGAYSGSPLPLCELLYLLVPKAVGVRALDNDWFAEIDY